MKRFLGPATIAIFTVFFAVTGVLSIAAQAATQRSTRPGGGDLGAERIAVLSFVNTTEVEQWDNLGRAIADTIELTLRLSGQFDVVDVPTEAGLDPYGPEGPLVLRDISVENRLDAIVIGRISDVENGRVELQAAAYSSAGGEIIGEETRRAFGSFDILDAADELVILTSSAFLGYSVDFGGIVLQPSRTDVAYRVYIDGVSVGRNIPSVPQVLTGQRTVDVAIVTAGGEQLVYSSAVTIRPGEAVEVSFALPAVTSRENRRIRASHTVAEELLSQPEEYLVAFEALSESRRLLLESTSERLEPLREQQRKLETLWQLEEELFRLRPAEYAVAGSYQPGDPLTMMRRSAEIAEDESGASRDETVLSLLRRNGAAQYHLLHIAWVEALSLADVDRAEEILDDLARVNEVYQLSMDAALREDRAIFQSALEESAGYARRRQRPWPYLGAAIGLGGIGYGGYLLATGDVAPYGNAEQAEIAQWTALSTGGAMALLSTWRIVRNRSAGDTFIKDWATDRYGREIALAEQVFSPDLGEEESTGTRVLALGPAGTLIHIDDQPRVFPVLLEIPSGIQLDTDRAPIARMDRERVYRSGFATAVFQ